MLKVGVRYLEVDALGSTLETPGYPEVLETLSTRNS